MVVRSGAASCPGPTLIGMPMARPLPSQSLLAFKTQAWQALPTIVHPMRLHQPMISLRLVVISADGADRREPRATPSRPQRALGVDYGRRHIGLAVSTLGLAPRPLQSVSASGGVSEMMRWAQEVLDAAVAEGEVEDVGALVLCEILALRGGTCFFFCFFVFPSFQIIRSLTTVSRSYPCSKFSA
jgi:hypothetical protein